tara:strand:+ start:2020 stop:2172 length:153 start_codon:yes stop_codon:yes gene_type:complete
MTNIIIKDPPPKRPWTVPIPDDNYRNNYDLIFNAKNNDTLQTKTHTKKSP